MTTSTAGAPAAAGGFDRSKAIATPEDFQKFIALCDGDEGWTVANKTEIFEVLSKSSTDSAVNIIKVKTALPDVEPEVLYDVLHDHFFRRTWDVSATCFCFCFLFPPPPSSSASNFFSSRTRIT